MCSHHIVPQDVSVRVSFHAIHDVMCLSVRWSFLVLLSPVSLLLLRLLCVAIFSITGNDASSFLVLEEFSSLFARVWSFCPKFLVAKLTFPCRFIWEFSTSMFECRRLKAISVRTELYSSVGLWVSEGLFVVDFPFADF